MTNRNYLQYAIFKPFKSWKNKYLKYIIRKEGQRKDLYNEVAREISEYLNEPVEEVKRKHKLGPESEVTFGIFKDQAGLKNSDIEGFYRDCSYYIYELPLWNAERNRPRYLSLLSLPYIRRNHGRKVLDFGAGAGDFCIELARQNLKVTYCDIADKTYDFARWRFNRRNLAIKMVKGIDSLSDKDYDCIFSFDAFEHVKDLPLLLEKLVAHLRTGGSLIFSGAFSGGTLHLEENEVYNEFKNLDQLMRKNGLTFQDKFAQFYFYKYTG